MRRGGGCAHARQLHQLLRAPCTRLAMARMCRSYCCDALVQVVHFAEQVADDGVGPAGQIFQQARAPGGARLSAFSGSTMPNSASRPRMRLMHGGARCDVALAGAVHHQPRSAGRSVLTGTKRMFGRVHGFADRRGVGGVVLAALAAHAVGRDELGRHQPHGVAVGCEQPRPVVRAGAGFHADGARRQRGDQLMQLGARHLGLTSCTACPLHPRRARQRRSWRDRFQR